MYSLSASEEPRRRWIASNCVLGFFWKQMKKRDSDARHAGAGHQPTPGEPVRVLGHSRVAPS
jgi:hypothetical protein